MGRNDDAYRNRRKNIFVATKSSYSYSRQLLLALIVYIDNFPIYDSRWV